MPDDRDAAKDLAALLRKVRVAAAEIDDALNALKPEEMTLDRWQDVLATHGVQAAALATATGCVSTHFGLSGGRERILHYLRRHIGRPVDGRELAGVSGIGEWARRVRTDPMPPARREPPR